MLGTFYRAESPGAAPFVEAGSQVEPDTIVCIIEVMKMMNSVRPGSPGSCRGVAENAELVEYGAPLFRVQAGMKRVFIANRGEIALRIVRACRELGLECVVGSSDVDLDGLAARSADRAVVHRSRTGRDSYLRDDAIVQAALGTGCDAIHPGLWLPVREPAPRGPGCASTG